MFYKNKRVIAYTLVVIILIQQLIGNIPVNAYANESVTGSNAIENVLTPSNAIKIETSSNANISNDVEIVGTGSNAINYKVEEIISLIKELPTYEEYENEILFYEENEQYSELQDYLFKLKIKVEYIYKKYKSLDENLKEEVDEECLNWLLDLRGMLSYINLDTQEEAEPAQVVLDKYVEKIDDNNYILTLESYISGQILNVKIPAHIIFALDHSGSMLTPAGASSTLGKTSLYYNEEENEGVPSYFDFESFNTEKK